MNTLIWIRWLLLVMNGSICWLARWIFILFTLKGFTVLLHHVLKRLIAPQLLSSCLCAV